MAPDMITPRSIDRWQRIVETLPQMVVTATPDGAVDYVSPPGASYAGLQQSALVGSGWLEIIHPEDRPASVRDWVVSMRTGEDYRAEHRLRRSDGEYRWFSCHARPSRDDTGRIEMWTGVWTDVTERRQAAEEANRRMQERIQQALRGSEITIEGIGDEGRERQDSSGNLEDNLGGNAVEVEPGTSVLNRRSRRLGQGTTSPIETLASGVVMARQGVLMIDGNDIGQALVGGVRA